MFYDSREEVLPNWWDALDEASELDHADLGQHSRGRNDSDFDCDSTVLEAATVGEDEAFQDERPHEKGARHGTQGTHGTHGTHESFHYPISEIHDPRLSEASDTVKTSCHGFSGLASAYDRDVIRSVWEFSEVVPGNDPDLWRKDEFGNWIYRLDYGRRSSEFGWEIFDPGVGRHCQGVYAMRPMQWQSFISQHEVMG